MIYQVVFIGLFLLSLPGLAALSEDAESALGAVLRGAAYVIASCLVCALIVLTMHRVYVITESVIGCEAPK